MKTKLPPAPKKLHRRSAGSMHGLRLFLLPFALAIGSIVSAGCVAAPVVMMTSAAVTAAAVAVEGEKAVQTPDAQTSAIAKNEAGFVQDHGKGCPPKGALGEEGKTVGNEGQEARKDCPGAGRHGEQTIQEPTSPKS